MSKRTWVIVLVIGVAIGLVGAYAAGIILPGDLSDDTVTQSPTDNSSSDDTDDGTSPSDQTIDEGDTTAHNDSTNPPATNNTTAPPQTVDDVTIASYAAKVVGYYAAQYNFSRDQLASTIDYSVSSEFAPGTVYGEGMGIFMYNDTWYPFTINETAVGAAYSGQVWDVIYLGPSERLTNFTIQQKSEGAWETIEPIIINGQSYCVLEPWDTSAGTHAIHLRYSYTGPSIEYKGDLVSLTPGGRVLGDDLLAPSNKAGGLFTANFIF